MSCKIPVVQHPIIDMINELTDKIGVDEYLRRVRQFWRVTDGHLTIWEVMCLLYEELIQGSELSENNDSG